MIHTGLLLTGRRRRAAPPADPPPLPGNGNVEWVGAYRAGYGSPGSLTNGSAAASPLGPLALQSGTAAALLAADTPAAAPALALTGTQTYAVALPGLTSRNTVVVVVGRPDSGGQTLAAFSGSALRLATSGQALQWGFPGGVDSIGLSATVQWTVFTGWAGQAAFTLQGGTNQRFNAATGQPNDTLGNLLVSFSGRLAAVYVGRLIDPVGYPGAYPVPGPGESIEQLHSPLYPLIRAGGAKGVNFRGNSLFASVSGTYAQSIPGALAALRTDLRVGCLAVSGLTTPELAAYATAQHDAAPAGPLVDIFTEMTNDYLFGANAGNTSACLTAFNAQGAARRASKPGARHVCTDVLPRVVGGGGQGAFDAFKGSTKASLAGVYTVPTGVTNLLAATNPATAPYSACWFWSDEGYTLEDEAHLDAASRSAAAARLAQVVAYYEAV